MEITSRTRRKSEIEFENKDRKRDRAEHDQELAKLEPKVRREGEQEDAGGEAHPAKWWGFVEPMEENGVSVAISQVELVNNLEEMWAKVGGKKLEEWIAEITKDIDEREVARGGQTR